MQSRPVIQEKAVIANRTDGWDPIGEAFRPGVPIPTKPLSEGMRQAMVSRLMMTTVDLIGRAAKTYEANCYKSGTKEIDPDYITRLSTNEFFFYTQEPLTLKEFEQLQNRLTHEAKKYSPGVQLILGSFAVKTDDNQVMNVVPYITCGQPPQFNFIVKNNTSGNDVRYNIPDGTGNTTLLKPCDIHTHDPAKPLPSIQVDGVKQDFTFNNIVPCKTRGGTTFLTAVDICLDHNLGVAQKHFANVPNRHNIPLSQVIISNWTYVQNDRCLVENPTQVDPYNSPTVCKQNTKQTRVSEEPPAFGNDRVAVYDLEKYKLLTPQEEFESAKGLLMSWFSYAGINPVNQSPLRLQFGRTTDYMAVQGFLDKQGVAYTKNSSDSLEIPDNFLNKNAFFNICNDVASLAEKNAIIAAQKALLKAPDLNITSQSPFVINLATPSMYLSTKKYFDMHRILYIENPPVSLELMDSFFLNPDKVANMVDTFNSPEKIAELNEAIQADQASLADSLVQLIANQATFQQQYNALQAFKEKPAGAEDLLSTMDNTLHFAARIIVDLKKYLEAPDLFRLDTQKDIVHTALSYIEQQQEELADFKKTFLHKDLKEIGSYYATKQGLTFFKEQPVSDVKIKILEAFKDNLMQIETPEAMQAFKDSLQEATHENFTKYQSLASVQNSTSKQDSPSVKVLNDMIEERESIISQAHSLSV